MIKAYKRYKQHLNTFIKSYKKVLKWIIKWNIVIKET